MSDRKRANFGYTDCPDACPTELQSISLALDKLGAAADPVRPVFGRRSRANCIDQWLIIQGRAVGKLLAPLFVFRIKRDGLPEQQPQAGPCAALY